ncbi:Urea amidolyase [Tolypocladium ophioglossoides CBS 100239]|uniref:Urea amidolyase n=1 Tax=Tolypocladium ophioglossoides (strain CBS 100239) TaxID=1163406 RepID=A0A0L0NGK2_TOLOC|nr:Urea amidolyase [Tolypocladium ophioglossoides CBS 100239]
MAPFIQDSNGVDLHSDQPTPLTTQHSAGYTNGDSQQPLVTIEDWRAAQLSDGGLGRILSLVDSERMANTKTRAWISLASSDQIQAQWSRLESQRHNAHQLPLFGVPFAVKDNIDVEGFPTTAACPAFTTLPAASDSAVVARLKAAGAIPIGKTNLDQFATGLVGTRSPHGAVPNPFDPARVSGESSSGSGVVVARGTVPFSLVTDTAGSGRVPAGLNNVVGLKPTRGALSTRGVLPACRTLDCVSIFALTVQDAQTVLSVAEAYDAKDSYSRSRAVEASPTPTAGFGTAAQDNRPPSFAICSQPNWYGRGDQYPAYEAALDKARAIGWQLTPVDFSDLFALAKLLYEGPWVAERHAAIKKFIEQSAEEDMDPVVRGIVSKGKKFTATDAFASEYIRQDLTRQITIVFRDFDGILVPTAPTFPAIEQVLADPVQENSLLGTYTNFVNFLDWSAISIPAGFRADGLPFGITLISNTWQEPQLFRFSQQWLSGETRRLGATTVFREADGSPVAGDGSSWTSVAVVGAHLTGFPLNNDLVSRGAKFETSTATSNMYRLFALYSASGPKKPGLERVTSPDRGRRIAVEVWKLPQHALASFMATIPSPLAIGSIELDGGRWVHGFVCEPIGLRNATDITDFGGWKAYMQHLQTHSQCNGVCTQYPELSCRAKKHISRVLIANRGEIAARIIRSLHKMNIEAVSIYSDADAGAPHVRDADVSLRLEGDSVAETYLDGLQVLKLAKSVQADAIIPGYGFLSENAEFAQAVEAAGLVWVGPTPEQMSDLGLKHRAREIAHSSGVQVVPGSSKLLTSLEGARREAEKIGFPLMLKSTAGGGGIGLRRCNDLESFDDAFNAVQRLAVANFGDSGVFLERFIENARHVEVQILGDGNGRVIAAGERDCSLQRRHQKVVEESPAFAVPEDIRNQMRTSAVRLASAVKYRNVGNVEFIYDVDSQEYFFLEVNTRLQVEHPVTEAVTGLDIVEYMLKIASDDGNELFDDSPGGIVARGASIEVRLYAENPLQSFRPCAGSITSLIFPSSLRVDTWVDVGTDVSTRYDPLLAKLIATGRDRQEAVERLAAGLAETEIKGVQTNLEYLRQIVSWSLFESGDYTTKSLDSFRFCSPSLEVLEPGAMTTIQDFPGRTGYWNVGIPPSGPMDHLSFRLANRLVNNSLDAAAIECTFQGPRFRFHCDTVVAITGAEAPVRLDDQAVACNQAFPLHAGQTLSIGSVENGYRVYITIAGGIAVPKVMGSRATFEVGSLGGKDGGKLHQGDILPIGTNQFSKPTVDTFPVAPLVPIQTQPNACWTIGVVPGPHGAPDYFTTDGLASLFAGEWRVHHNSNRLGIRLTGPRPQWARQTGGEAGLHPSNIHDSPYSIGSVSFTGDEAVVLTCDGPSLGGFVVFCVVASSEMWKLGQARPGDTIRLHAIGTEIALRLDKELDGAIQDLRELPRLEDFCGADGESRSASAVAGEIRCGVEKIVARQAGDRAMILEFGEGEVFDLRQSFKIHAFCQNHRRKPIEGVDEVTPGVRTVHIIYDSGLSPRGILDRLHHHVSSYTVPNRVSSRTLHLPLAFDDSVSQAAVERYAATIRSEAPWLPSNVAFLEKLNGSSDISSLLYDATFLVLGLGDVFLGSPCAVPLDPRHRLFGTKYNPSRSFTPRRSVGIGGQYMCIYATDSPGGYQLVGRTVDIWDCKAVPSGDEPPVVARSSVETASSASVDPWMFRSFDRIMFYAVKESELDAKPASQLISITDGELDLEEYEAWIDSHREDIAAVAAHRETSISNAPFLDELHQPYRPNHSTDSAINSIEKSALSMGGEKIKAMMPGRCYSFVVKENSTVRKGDVLMWIESSKMEIEIRSPVGGKCTRVLVKDGALVDAGETLVTIEPNGRVE